MVFQEGRGAVKLDALEEGPDEELDLVRLGHLRGSWEAMIGEGGFGDGSGHDGINWVVMGNKMIFGRLAALLL